MTVKASRLAGTRAVPSGRTSPAREGEYAAFLQGICEKINLGINNYYLLYFPPAVWSPPGPEWLNKKNGNNYSLTINF
jgi:hypothetical protein